MHARKVTQQLSAGGVVVDERRVLVIRTRNRRGRTVWTFPKGRLEDGEQREEAALREVFEETGYHCRPLRALSETNYWFHSGPTRIQKTVYWYFLEPIEKSGRHNPEEVDEVRWMPFHEAYYRLSYRGDRRLLAEAEALVDA